MAGVERIAVMWLLLVLALPACTSEARRIGPGQPLTGPTGPDDPRISYFQENVEQVSRGSRYAGYYGCARCHGADGDGQVSLAVVRVGAAPFDAVYRTIAQGHPADMPRYGDLIPPEQLWQITAYVRDLSGVAPEQRRRRALDASSEPQGGVR